MYDVTSYLEEHPGGDDVVLASTGISVILSIIYVAWLHHWIFLPFNDVNFEFWIHPEVFNSKSYLFQCYILRSDCNVFVAKDATNDFEDAGHSKSARELLETFCIGELDTSAPAIPEQEVSSQKQYAEKVMNLTKVYWAVPVAVVGISVVVGILYLRRKWSNAIAIFSSVGC